MSAKQTPKAAGSEATSPPKGGSARRDLMENEIFSKALHLFSERGYDATSLQDLADAMGLTRPALYYYVRSKESLLERLVAETAEEPMEGLREIAHTADLPPVERLRAAARLLALMRAKKADQYRLLERTEGNLPESMAASFLKARRAVLREFVHIVSDGVRSGDFIPVDERVSALAVLGMCNWIAWWYDEERGGSAEELADVIAELAVRTLLREDKASMHESGPRGVVGRMRQELDLLERLLEEDA